MWPRAKAAVGAAAETVAVVEAEAGGGPEPETVHEAKAEQAAEAEEEAEEEAKAAFVQRAEREAKVGLVAGVRAGAGARRVTYGAKAGPGDPDH